jgi:cytidylate kinase
MLREVVAIDGPAGAGKSTVAKAVAKELGFTYLDTGAMYRCIALLATRNGLGPNDGDAAATLATDTQIEFRLGEPQTVLLDGEDVTSLIRTMEIGELASALSANSDVRKELVKRQKLLCDLGRVVLEGRDTTTVVCPDARLKIYMTASVAERSRRRWKELQAKGDTTPLEDIRQQIALRDERDTTRADSPLRVADDAVTIDTDAMSADEVIARVLAEWTSRLLAS